MCGVIDQINDAIQNKVLAWRETAYLSYLSVEQWPALVTCNLCFVPTNQVYREHNLKTLTIAIHFQSRIVK